MKDDALVMERIMSRIMPIPESGCWIWEGSISDGYGQISVGKKTRFVHRIMFELTKGPIPPGLVSDHLCRVRCCVNPDHIELVTNRENVGRGVGATAHAIRTNHCKHGHEFTPENTMKRRRGTKECLMCNRIRNRKPTPITPNEEA